MSYLGLMWPNYGGDIRLTEASPVQTFTEPLSLTEVKSYLRLPLARSPVSPEEDAELRMFIIAARAAAERERGGQDLVRKQWDLSLDYWRDAQIILRWPLVSVDLVQTRDSLGATTTRGENTDYVVDLPSNRITPPYGAWWPTFTPWPSSGVLVRFTSGIASSSAFWLDDGAHLKAAMLRLIRNWKLGKLPMFDPSGTAESDLTPSIRAAFTLGGRRFVS